MSGTATPPLRVLITTDSFPPGCGGSGWSTYELARGLRTRGHDVAIVHVRPGPSDTLGTTSYDGFTVTQFSTRAPQVPFVRNYWKSERLTHRLGGWLAGRIAERKADVVHAQHVMSTPPSIAAASRAGVPVVVTVRDYWPVCYWSDLIHDPNAPGLCPACTAGGMVRCLRPRAGAAWPAALPLIPYMRANLARKQRALASADAVVAVSRRIADDLCARSRGLPRERVTLVPNPVDLASLDAAANRAREAGPLLDGPYALYVGKLATNKGVLKLVPALEAADLRWPLVIVGDGPERISLERAFRDRGRDVRVLGWRSRDEVIAWMAHATLLVFPSHGPESLSRVLLEASAVGVPIAAMDTGGTRDIVEPGVTGLLSSDAAGLGQDVRRLADDPELRARLGASARSHVETTFAAPAVAARIEAVYRRVIAARSPRANGTAAEVLR